MGMINFAQIMHNWQRMCKYFDEHYHEDCCHICPVQNCGAIWEMDEATNWEEIEEIINTWAAEHKEPIYPSWREYLKKMGLTTPKSVYFTDEHGTGVKLEDGLTEKPTNLFPLKLLLHLDWSRTMSKILTNHDICSIGEIGEVVWLECYFDGHTSLQPYMFDIGFTQKPVMINGNDNFYNLYESDVKGHITSGFGIRWHDKRYRWWDSKPTDEERKNCSKWYYILSELI